MAAPAFGFSAGDSIAGTRIVIAVYKAFKESGGASSEYTSESLFLDSLTSTMKQLEDYTVATPNTSVSPAIEKLLRLIDEPLKDFGKALEKYKPTALYIDEITTRQGTKNRVIEQPLQQIESLLSLHLIKSIDELPQRQCVQIVDAMLATDVPAALKSLLVQFSKEQFNRHDEQVRLQEDLQSRMEDLLAGLQTELGNTQDTLAASTASMNDHRQAQLQELKGMQKSISKLSADSQPKAD
ncbi:hypothetical protein E8E11_010912 [Didymella keratinophila]|nr:hypothetical protein E8E11_010912 [Didymella keratinophila]